MGKYTKQLPFQEKNYYKTSYYIASLLKPKKTVKLSDRFRNGRLFLRAGRHGNGKEKNMKNRRQEKEDVIQDGTSLRWLDFPD